MYLSVPVHSVVYVLVPLCALPLYKRAQRRIGLRKLSYAYESLFVVPRRAYCLVRVLIHVYAYVSPRTSLSIWAICLKSGLLIYVVPHILNVASHL